ncbi:ThiF family adenylyltransferase, partial [Staphylococcus saprophyticus]
IMGAGALGSHVAAQLARMGARNLYIVDMDIIETSNLHRQSLYTEEDADNMLPKVEAIKQHIQHINSEVNVTTFYQEVESSTIEALLT